MSRWPTTGHVPAYVMVRGDVGHLPTRIAAGVAITLAQAIGPTKLLACDHRSNVMLVTIEASSEGFEWCRGWDNEAVNAMLAARALR